MKYALNTEIGLMGIWDIHALDFIIDKASYDENVAKDAGLTKLINEQNVVIWGVGGDGKRVIDFRIGEQLRDEEKSRVEMESSEYKLVVKSGKVVVGSPEWVGGVQEEGLNDRENGIKCFDLDNGQYRVKIYFLYWSDEIEDDSDKLEFIVCMDRLPDSENFSPQAEFETLA